MSRPELLSLLSAIPVYKIRYDDQGLVPAIVQDY
ncbi:MAG: bifunctional phosphoribosyl-AMP cyclohydrolase/phosphoribosyl-ATP diphosphatase, partial [Aphanizomenon sp.]